MNEKARWSMLRDIGVAVAGVAALVVVAGFFSGNGLGQQAPDFDLVAVQGGVIEPTTHERMVLQFWIVGCGPCKRQIKSFSRYADTHPDVPIYAVNANGLEMQQLAAQARRTGASYPVLRGNPRLARDFGVSAYPTTVVLENGVVVARQRGSFSAEALDGLLAGL